MKVEYYTPLKFLCPAMAHIDRARFTEFHNMHTQPITFVVGPIMLVELGTAIVLLLTRRQELLVWSVGLGAVFLIWLSTAFVSVPIHNALARGHDLHQIERLISTNWPRTILWTLRLVLISYQTAGFSSPPLFN